MRSIHICTQCKWLFFLSFSLSFSFFVLFLSISTTKFQILLTKLYFVNYVSVCMCTSRVYLFIGIIKYLKTDRAAAFFFYFTFEFPKYVEYLKFFFGQILRNVDCVKYALMCVCVSVCFFSRIVCLWGNSKNGHRCIDDAHFQKRGTNYTIVLHDKYIFSVYIIFFFILSLNK